MRMGASTLLDAAGDDQRTARQRFWVGERSPCVTRPEYVAGSPSTFCRNLDRSSPNRAAMIRQLVFLACGAALVAAAPSLAASQEGTHSLPLKHDPEPTSAAISARDLMTRLYIFADDSMMGRETGTRGHLMSTAYIANELRRLGLKPAGDKGTFFQDVPMIRRAFDLASTITVDEKTLHGGTDFIASAPTGAVPSLAAVDVIFGGRPGDSTAALTPEQMRGKLLLQYPAPRGAGRGGFGGRGGRGGGAAVVAT